MQQPEIVTSHAFQCRDKNLNANFFHNLEIFIFSRIFIIKGVKKNQVNGKILFFVFNKMLPGPGT